MVLLFLPSRFALIVTYWLKVPKCLLMPVISFSIVFYQMNTSINQLKPHIV